MTVAYLRHLGPYGEAISRFWQHTYHPWAAINNLLEKPRYGISHDDPSITAPEQCRYDACAEVPSDFVTSGNAFKTTIPGGKYAALAFNGTIGAWINAGALSKAFLAGICSGNGVYGDRCFCRAFAIKG